MRNNASADSFNGLIDLDRYLGITQSFCALRQTYPQWSLRPKRLNLVALCNDYFIVCFEHQCNTMRAF